MVLLFCLSACAGTENLDGVASSAPHSHQENSTPSKTTTTRKSSRSKEKTTTTKKMTTTSRTTTTTSRTTTTTTRKPTTTTARPTTTTTVRPTTTTTARPTTTTTARPTTTTTTQPKPKTYGAGQTWKVAGQFELTVNKVTQHRICDKSCDEIGNAKTAVLLEYTYKNIGSEDIEISKWDYSVYDGAGEAAQDQLYFEIYCDHVTKEAKECIPGTKCTAENAILLLNESDSITIFFEVDDATATFVVPVSPAPPEDTEEEDKLDGCTITVENSLPETFSHYYDSYDGKHTCSCSVTEVTFEVSGDDLYIYFSGRKTYDSRGDGQSDSCKISWKLYDADTNTVLANGTASTLGLANGEGFSKAKDTAYDCITPGGNYKLVLLNTN